MKKDHGFNKGRSLGQLVDLDEANTQIFKHNFKYDFNLKT